MNLTPQLALHAPVHTETEAHDELSKQHPGIVLNPDGTYTYRGYRFNHFLAGIATELGQANAYLLTDVVDPSLWLFTYGEAEERWADFVAAKERQVRLAREAKRGWFARTFL